MRRAEEEEAGSSRDSGGASSCERGGLRAGTVQLGDAGVTATTKQRVTAGWGLERKSGNGAQTQNVARGSPHVNVGPEAARGSRVRARHSSLPLSSAPLNLDPWVLRSSRCYCTSAQAVDPPALLPTRRPPTPTGRPHQLAGLPIEPAQSAHSMVSECTRSHRVWHHM